MRKIKTQGVPRCHPCYVRDMNRRIALNLIREASAHLTRRLGLAPEYDQRRGPKWPAESMRVTQTIPAYHLLV